MKPINDSININSNGLIKDKSETILLVLLPFWVPLIPPVGITGLKSYLQERGYTVDTADFNVDPRLREIEAGYMNLLEEFIPKDKRNHLRNIGVDVLRHHLMAHTHHTDNTQYAELVRHVIYETFYFPIDDSQALQLTQKVDLFFKELKELFMELLQKSNPTVLGLSVYSGSLPASLFCFNLAREFNPAITNVMGGAVFSGELTVGSPNYNDLVESTPDIDYIIVGEGEKLFERLLNGDVPDSQRVFTQDDTRSDKPMDMAEVIAPDFSDMELNYYPLIANSTSRSCPFQCSFCCETIHWGAFRIKEAKQTAQELYHLSDKHGIQLFLMCDSLLNPVINKLSRELMNSDKSVYWDGYLRADRPVCDTKNTMKWRKAGFYRARLGVESGSANVLKLMNKMITPQQIKDALASLAYAGIKTTTYWVIGHPGETEEDFRETLDLIEEMQEYIYEADCNPFNYYLDGQVNSGFWSGTPHSAIYSEAEKEMLRIQTYALDIEPSRREVYDRVNRFVKHIKRIGVPNPYTLEEVYQADERWKQIHKHAVPSLVDFMQARENKDLYIDENKRVKEIVPAKNIAMDDGNWGF
ncbi:MAG: radical SAM protein [bacterium]|nr:radical SAM protein [bacterium]